MNHVDFAWHTLTDDNTAASSTQEADLLIISGWGLRGRRPPPALCVIECDNQAKPGATRRASRCGQIFDKAATWLREKFLPGEHHPLHLITLHHHDQQTSSKELAQNALGRAPVEKSKTMKPTPFLIPEPMVQAILEGRKTQTRRIVDIVGWRSWVWAKDYGFCTDPDQYKPFARRQNNTEPHIQDLIIPYRDDGSLHIPWSKCRREMMSCPYGGPQWLDFKADRLLVKENCIVEISGVRVERLHDISADDAIAEGIEPYTESDATTFKDYLVGAMGGGLTAQQSFQTLWQLNHGYYSWDVNPWVWVIEFKRIEP